jgi:hypothetical protein
MLEPQEEYMLDRDVAEKLITSHLRLAAKIAMGYRGYGMHARLGGQRRPDAGGRSGGCANASKAFSVLDQSDPETVFAWGSAMFLLSTERPIDDE